MKWENALLERSLECSSNNLPPSSKGEKKIGLFQLKHHRLSKMKQPEIALVSTQGICHLRDQDYSCLPKQQTEGAAREPEAAAAWKYTFMAWHFGGF